MSEFFFRKHYTYSNAFDKDRKEKEAGLVKDGCDVESGEIDLITSEVVGAKKLTINEILDSQVEPDMTDATVHICNHDKGLPCEVVTLKKFKETYGAVRRRSKRSFKR